MFAIVEGSLRSFVANESLVGDNGDTTLSAHSLGGRTMYTTPVHSTWAHGECYDTQYCEYSSTLLLGKRGNVKDTVVAVLVP
jgi:hypothetical protein